MPFSLERVCVCRSWILTALPVDSCEALDLTHSSLLTNLFPYLHHFPTLFTLLISSMPFSLHFPFLFLSLASSLPYFLQIPTLFSSLLSSLPYFRHFPTLVTSILSSHPYALHFLTLFTFLLSSFPHSQTSLASSCPYSFHSTLFNLHFPSLFISLVSCSCTMFTSLLS